ncbi:hypothetical protein NIES39_D00050 [Arthrospira platensis NIES-39]|nr:hypothetical protein NIES39_D00050 [Arthrospira platensis NIES-39]
MCANNIDSQPPVTQTAQDHEAWDRLLKNHSPELQAAKIATWTAKFMRSSRRR